MNRTRVAIIGCTGRMGRALLRLAARDEACALAAAVTVPGDAAAGADAGRVAGLDDVGVTVSEELRAECDAAIEFTSPAGCLHWAEVCAAEELPLVSGTTGLRGVEQERLRDLARQIPIVWAPNMSVGVNLLLALVEDAARRVDAAGWDVEVCETHHRQKVDAPSGTARALVDAVQAGRAAAGQAEGGAAGGVVYGREGQVGARPRGEIGVHALRMGAIVGEHEVHFTSETESVVLAHRAFSRDAFAAGALRAARWIVGRPAGLYSMRDVLGM